MGKKKRKAVDLHANCDHSNEAHEVLARCHDAAVSILVEGMKQGVPPNVMMVTAIVTGLQAGSMFPEQAKRMFGELGMDPKATAELYKAAANIIAPPAPSNDITH